MFVTILTIIYSAIALYIMAWFIREKASKLTIWTSNLLLKLQRHLFGNRDWKDSEAGKKQISDLTTEVKA